MNRGIFLAAAAAAVLGLSGCGDDPPAGPEFGDLVFEPDSPIEIADARQVTVELFNLTNEALGPVMLGVGGIPTSFPPEFVCTGVVIDVDPVQIQSISPEQSFEVDLTFDFAGLTEEDCPFATYEVDLNAAVGSQVLGSAQIRVDHTQLE